jgi:HEAT repeat protein
LLDVPILSEAAADALGHLGGEDVIAPLLAMLDAPDAPVAAVVSAIDRLAERRGASADSPVAARVRAAMTPARSQKLVEAVQQAGVPARPLARVLGWLEGRAAERALTRMLGRDDAREEALQALAGAGPRVVDVLLEQLGAEDLETRRAAVVALARIRDPRAVPALIDALGDAEVLPLVTRALGGLGDPRAFEPLWDLLRHETGIARRAAMSSLVSLRHPASESRVLSWLEDPDPRRREAAVTLVPHLARRAGLEALRRGCVDAVESVRRAAVAAIAVLDDDRALPLLLDASRDGAPAVRAAAARALADVRAPSPRIELALLESLGDADAWVRYFAARALGQRRAVSAVAALARLTRTDNAPHVSIAAAEALAVIGGRDAHAVLVTLTGSSNADLARVAREATRAERAPSP